MTRCLVVDDDAEIRDAVTHYLQSFGFETRGAADGAAMRRQLSAAPVDVMVLDVMLPGEDGLALLRWLRQHPEHRHLPVLMLTVRGDTASRVVGLELGADDYLPKPFEPRELVARLQAILRRGSRGTFEGREMSADARLLHFASWKFDRVARGHPRSAGHGHRVQPHVAADPGPVPRARADDRRHLARPAHAETPCWKSSVAVKAHRLRCSAPT